MGSTSEICSKFSKPKTGIFIRDFMFLREFKSVIRGKQYGLVKRDKEIDLDWMGATCQSSKKSCQDFDQDFFLVFILHFHQNSFISSFILAKTREEKGREKLPCSSLDSLLNP